MPIIESVTSSIFNGQAVHIGDCIRAKKTYWNDFRNGFITEITNTEITVLFFTPAGNAANYYKILADEVTGGLWKLYWTTDFVTVYSESVNSE